MNEKYLRPRGGYSAAAGVLSQSTLNLNGIVHFVSQDSKEQPEQVALFCNG
jgi:hypothetical protein